MGLAAHRVGLASNYLEAGFARSQPSDAGPFNAVSRAETLHYMQDTLLRDTDANSMRHSLEVRLPFLDLNLVNYVGSLPSDVKYGFGLPSKLLLRQAARGVLNKTISRRPKTGFTLPIDNWMRGKMRDSCDESIRYLAELAILNGNEVRRTWQAFKTKPRSMHWPRPLALVVLGDYLRNNSGNHRDAAQRSSENSH
jgi:asparagine synthase (glutamine-hydrolysing)